MKTKTFIGNDIRQALAMAREAMGSDAIVVSTRRVGDKTEVVARHDGNNSPPGQVSQDRVAGDPAAIKDDQVSSIIRVIQEEVTRLRDTFQTELQHIGWREMASKQPAKFELIRRLLACGFSKQAAKVIVDKVMPIPNVDEGWRAVKDRLRKYIPTNYQDITDEGGIFALVGCTGVGKTTTAAKLAGQFARKHGFKEVAFVSMDKFKVGGHEQLVSLGTMFGIPVQAVSSAEEMEKTLHALASKKLIIIDTAGVSQRDNALLPQLEMLRVSVPIKPLLVLPATSRWAIVKETIDSFKRITPAATIITKIDEADCIGPVLAHLIVSRLPLAYISNGQNVPDDLVAASADMIIKEIEDTYLLSQKNGIRRNPAVARKAV